MSETKSTPSLESTLKSLDTEEFIDIHFYRPIGYQWALFFNKLGVSPNSITIASIFIGIAAGICFYFQSLAINVIGMLLLIWANSYDSADGQLARMTGQKSALGRILDGAAGDFFTGRVVISSIENCASLQVSRKACASSLVLKRLDNSAFTSTSFPSTSGTSNTAVTR